MIEFNHISNPGYHPTPEFEGGKVNAKWVGSGKQLLGLPDEFDPAMYQRLLAGLNPHDGSRLSARLSKVRRMGWDVTTTNEKDVAVLELVAGDDRIAKLREEAMDFVVKRLEKQIGVRVRQGGKNSDRLTDVLVGAAFSHETNRLAEPHGHWHICVANLSFDKKESKWKAVELVNVDRPKLVRDYHRFMAKGLRGLGYRVKTHGNRYDIQGVPDVADRFSTRNKQIKGKEAEYDQAAKDKGSKPMSDKARAKLSLYDRPPKVGNGSREAMHRSWVDKLDEPERMGLELAVKRARAKVRAESWAVDARMAFERQRGVERAYDEPERSSGRTR